MTLIEAIELLQENSIPFEQCEYSSETDYWYHTMMISNTKNAKSCKVAALIIPSQNNHTNIELQFNEQDDDFIFRDLWFGSLSFEEFMVSEETLADDIIERISEIRQGALTVVTVYGMNIKGRFWIADMCFDRNDTEDDLFGEAGFQKAMRRFQKRKGLFGKMFQRQRQYEIYDWNSYQCIIN